MNSKESKTVYTIAQIFSLFSMEREEIGIREASQILGIYPSNIHRLFATLEKCGFLEKNENRRYRLGEKIFAVGSLYPFSFPLRKIVRPHAEELAKIHNTGVHFGIISKHPPYSVIILDRIINFESSSQIHRISYNIPVHTSGVGKAILAHLPIKERNQILASLVLTKFTENTITDKKRFLAALEKIREDGYAIDRAETHLNIFCVAAPIFQNEKVVGSLSLTDSGGRLNEKKFIEVGRALKERTEFISRQL